MRLSLVAVCAMLLTSGYASADKGLAPGRHVLEGEEVSVFNVAGTMEVVPGSGPSVVVEVTPRDATPGD